MGLGKQMIEQLQQLSAAEQAAQAASDERRLLVAGDALQQATLEFFDSDRYSVSMRMLSVGAGAFDGDARAYLSARAAEIARRLSYLEEPLAVWELDGAERLAQLRSSPPLREGEEVTYWEVALSLGEQPAARLQRYRWTPGLTERQEIAYPATFALVGRLTDSLAAALASELE